MALLYGNQVSLIKNILRYPQAPTLRYFNKDLPKKLKNLGVALKHYKRFIREPHIIHRTFSDSYPYSVGEYGFLLKAVGDIMDVKIIWKKRLNYYDRPVRTVVYIGEPKDVEITILLVNMLIRVIEWVHISEMYTYQKEFITQRRGIQRNGLKEPRMVKPSAYSRIFKMNLLAFINKELFKLLDKKSTAKYFKPIYRYISLHFKLKVDRRGNPSWSPDYESWKRKSSKDLLFRENKLLN